jgi:tetratricopeptide (TPR) repeat protein
MNDEARTERALHEALGLDPEPIEAHAKLVTLLRGSNRTADLVGALRAWSEVEPNGGKRIALLREAADLARKELAQPELAAEHYQALVGIDRDDVEGLRALSEIRSSQGRWNEVVGLLERMLEVVPPDERPAVARAMGEAYRDHLADPRAAIRSYEAALDLDDSDAVSMDALEVLYRDHDRLEALRSLLETRAERAEGPDRNALQLRLAQLYEHSFRDQTSAIAMFRQVLDSDPGNAIAQNELERLFEATGAWDELVALILSRVGDSSDEEQRTLLERVAQVHDTQRGDTDSAIRVYERIGSDLGADDRSLTALAELYERKESWTKVADTLERLAARLDGQEAISTCHRVVDLYEQQVGDEAQAGRALRGAYERFPSDEATRNRLKAYYEARGEYQALAQVLDAELESAASTDEERVALLRAISDVYCDKLEDPGTAAIYLERAVQLGSEDRAALVPLCELYMAAGRQQDAVPILQRIIESFGKQRSKELAKHYHRLGQALSGMGDAAGALQAYDAAFKIDLTNVAILRDLGKLTHANGDLDRAQKSFRALLLQKLEPDSGIQKADVYYYLGDIAAKQGDPRKAITMLERALAEDASHEQASELLAQLKG